MLRDCVKQKGGCEVFMSTSEVFVLKMQKEGKSICGFFWYLLTTLLGWSKRKPHSPEIEEGAFKLDSLILN